jgi:hypothetical protein
LPPILQAIEYDNDDEEWEWSGVGGNMGSRGHARELARLLLRLVSLHPHLPWPQPHQDLHALTLTHGVREREREREREEFNEEEVVVTSLFRRGAALIAAVDAL